MKIEDYLHLYLGCEVEASWWGNKKVRLVLKPAMLEWDIKPILRPLSSMTEDEAWQLDKLIDENTDNEGWMVHKYYQTTSFLEPIQFKWLLSHGFDLFGLIDAGLAIDKTLKMNKEKQNGEGRGEQFGGVF